MKFFRRVPAMMWLSLGAVVLAIALVVAPSGASTVFAEPSDVCTDVPDSGPNFNFTSACQKHDACYGQFGGNVQRTATREIIRAACDQTFLQNMKASCTAAFMTNQISFIGYVSCNSRAMIYYDGVRAFGGNFFYTQPR